MDARILLVDDDPTFLAIARDLVRSLVPDVPVTAVEGAEPALEVLDAWDRGEVQALVVTDYIMPDMNGMDLIRASRELHPNSGFQYACLTTVFHRAVLARTKQAGAVRAEVKPDSVEALASILQSIISPWRKSLSITA